MSNIRPFVKWVGGKTQLLPALEYYIPPSITRYTEPFVGGGAFFFYLLRNRPNITEFYISDINPDLINLYEVIRDKHMQFLSKIRSLITEYFSLSFVDREKFYIDRRDSFNSSQNDPVTQASIMLFLNRTCFNGLWRVNSDGKFNASWNKRGDVYRLCHDEVIIEIHEAFEARNISIKCVDYKDSLTWISEDPQKTLVYLDPPYWPVSDTANFTSYTIENFDLLQQKELLEFFKNLNIIESYAILSNSNSDDNVIRDLYHEFRIEVVKVNRVINSDPAKRSDSTELIITNFPKQQISLNYDFLKDDEDGS